MDKLLTKFTEFQVRNNISDSEDSEIIAYGLREGIVALINILSTIIIGSLFGLFWSSLIFLVIYSPLRIFSGGFHAKNHVNCFILSTILNMVLFSTLKYVPINIGTVILIVVISSIVIGILAPVEDKNKPLDAREVIKYRKKARMILLIHIAIFTITVVLELSIISKTISLSLCMLAIMLVAGTIKNRLELKS